MEEIYGQPGVSREATSLFAQVYTLVLAKRDPYLVPGRYLSRFLLGGESRRGFFVKESAIT
jgi:hypothetical protein